MSCSTTLADHATPPRADELEVSVFGPGVGESIVVHLGDSRWVVVDSCVAPDTKRAVALDYLGEIGVDVLEQLLMLVVTHWHDDHSKGASDLLDTAPNADLVLAAALRSDDLKQLMAASSDPFVQPSGATECRSLGSGSDGAGTRGRTTWVSRCGSGITTRRCCLAPTSSSEAHLAAGRRSSHIRRGLRRRRLSSRCRTTDHPARMSLGCGARCSPMSPMP